MIKKQCLILFLLFGCFFTSKAQYFYKDIYKTKRTNKTYQRNKKNHTREIKILSFDEQHHPIAGFLFKKTFDTTENKTLTVSKSSYSDKNYTTSYFDNKNRLFYTKDSTASHTNSTRIFYDNAGRIDSIVFLNFSARQHEDSLYNFRLPDTLKEKHAYTYAADGNLSKMTRWKNNRLYKTIYFKSDSQGHVFKEYEKRKASPLYYYKYKKGLLTDVFHFSYKERKMIPDYLLNYNQKKQVVQKTVVIANKHDYLKWQYTYNEYGQKNSQKGYNRKGILQGSLKYKYFSFH